MFSFPGGKKFAFTIIDDTDDAYLENIAPIYELLHNSGLRTTKTVWVYPVRDHERSKGSSLTNDAYLSFVKSLQKKGFEIGLHNVGSGEFSRNEIIEGLETYKNLLGEYPNIHINHSYNPDNIYCGSKRFSFPFNIIVDKLYSKYSNFSGELPESEHFWADYHKRLIKYGRNYDIDDINTVRRNPFMPYKDKVYDEYSNYWFSSTFASNQWMFNKIVNKSSINRLEREGGVCILYTHLGYYMAHGKIDPGFVRAIEELSKRTAGWYVPVSELLDYLKEKKQVEGVPDYIPTYFKKWLEFRSLWTRIKYRYFIRKDDSHFKASKQYDLREDSCIDEHRTIRKKHQNE